ERYFNRALQTAPTDNERLSSAVVLGQLLLLGKKHAEYAELATKTIWPLLARSSRPGQEVALPRVGNDFDPRALLWGGAGLATYAPEFVASLTAGQVSALVPRWVDLRAGTTGEVFRLTADLFLEAAYKKLAQQRERAEVTGRIAASPARQRYLPNGIGGLV